MSTRREENAKRLTASDISARKGKDALVCLTAYTAPMAHLLDDACDLILVGDSAGMALHGLPDTIGVTLETMILHGQAVMRGCRHAMVVVDMPFGSYEGPCEIAHANAVRILKETGASAIKVENGTTVHVTIDYLVRRGIPVMGHVGLRPQSVLVDGGFRAKGRTPGERSSVMEEARAAFEAGAFAIVVEGVAEPLAREITQAVGIPTLGIGASVGCDGQILVTEDMLGLFERTPKFVRRYANLRDEIGRAVALYASDVRARRFPSSAETYFNVE